MSDYRKYFIKAIEAAFPSKASELIINMENHFKAILPDVAFASVSKNPIDKRLDFCSYFLALIKALDEQGETFATIRKICLDVVTDYVRPKNELQRLLKRLPPKLINSWLAPFFLQALAKKTSKNANPNGFIATILTDKEQTFGFGYGVDILECGICKLFHKHHYQPYASILCEVDEITSGLAGLTLIRTGTIANGAQKCDFRFIKK